MAQATGLSNFKPISPEGATCAWFMSHLQCLESNAPKPVADATGYNLPSLSGLEWSNFKNRQRGTEALEFASLALRVTFLLPHFLQRSKRVLQFLLAPDCVKMA